MLQPAVENVDPDVEQSTIMFKASDGFELRAFVCRPRNPTKKNRPGLLVVYHGGGGVIGRPEGEVMMLRSLVKNLKIVGVSLQYRLGPESSWLIGLEDAWDGLKWCATNAADILHANLDAGFVVGGVSNGAGLASSVAHRARDEKLTPKLTGVFFSAGSVVSEELLPEKFRDRYFSRTQQECMDAPILDQQMKAFFNATNRKDLKDPKCWSLLWPSGHADLPKHYLQSCGMDVTRDDALLFEEVLREESGVETRLDIYPGTPHVFWTTFRTLGQTKKWEKDTVDGVGWLFGLDQQQRQSSL